MGNEIMGETVQSMSEQERLQQCNAEIAEVLNKYNCELGAIPQTRAEGSIVLVTAIPRLSIRTR